MGRSDARMRKQVPPLTLDHTPGCILLPEEEPGGNLSRLGTWYTMFFQEKKRLFSQFPSKGTIT
jgi:hypothetical protein